MYKIKINNKLSHMKFYDLSEAIQWLDDTANFSLALNHAIYYSGDTLYIREFIMCELYDNTYEIVEVCNV